MSQKSSQKGFTIIEVVLVLAIAALIFLVVFLAVPALQRSQRDTQRRADVGRIFTAVTNHAGNRQGTIPTTIDDAWVFSNVRANSHDESFSDPRGNTNTYTSGAITSAQYAITTNNNTSIPTYSQNNNGMVYRPNHKCVTDTPGIATASGAGNRSFAIVIPLEGGDFYCQDS